MNKESNFSLDTTKTYEVSPLKSEEMTKRLIKDYEDVNKYGIKEESLCQEYKELLDMYMKQRNMIDIDIAILRTWQTALLEYMVPTNREVIWIIGTKGNEGKSWFQEFLESKFGWHRVICSMDIKMKKGNICQALRKRSLMTSNKNMFVVMRDLFRRAWQIFPFFILISMLQIIRCHPNFDSRNSCKYDFPSFPFVPTI